MAGFATAARLAASSDDPVEALDRLATRIARAPAAIAAYGAPLLALDRRRDPLRILTISRSAAVERTLVAAHALRPIVVCCAEGRPAFEGRGLAEALANHGLTVELYTDAGLSGAVPRAQSVVVGADAIAAGLFVNKVGTAAICALADSAGVPSYVLAGREKLLTSDEFQALDLRAGLPAEVWSDAPGAVSVLNPYFETVSLRLITGVVTDIGVLTAEDLTRVEQI
jgi:translation initiation factor 2B subunit (eIF-2B alpha/beta/delta family)